MFRIYVTARLGTTVFSILTTFLVLVVMRLVILGCSRVEKDMEGE